MAPSNSFSLHLLIYLAAFVTLPLLRQWSSRSVPIFGINVVRAKTVQMYHRVIFDFGLCWILQTVSLIFHYVVELFSGWRQFWWKPFLSMWGHARSPSLNCLWLHLVSYGFHAVTDNIYSVPHQFVCFHKRVSKVFNITTPSSSDAFAGSKHQTARQP